MPTRNTSSAPTPPANLFKRAWAASIDFGLCSLSLPLFTRLTDHFYTNIIAYFAREAVFGDGITFELVSACITALGLVMLLGILAWFFGSTLFLALMEWYFGATPGKYLLGLAVIPENARALGLLRAYSRQSAKFFSGLLFGVGFLLVFFTWRRQALHDRIARCYVVQAFNPKQYYAPLVLTAILAYLAYPSIRASGEKFVGDVKRIHHAYTALSPVASIAWKIVSKGLEDLSRTPE